MRTKDIMTIVGMFEKPLCILATTLAVWVAYQITGDKDVVWGLAIAAWWFF